MKDQTPFNSTRRDILKAAALAAASMAVPGCATNSRQAGSDSDSGIQPTTRPVASSHVAASDRLRIACIGLHGRGKAHVDAYADMKDVEIVYLCDCDANVVGPHMKYVQA